MHRPSVSDSLILDPPIARFAGLFFAPCFCTMRLLGALVMAIIWWLANKVTKVVDQPDFDNEIHWHKYRDVQSKRGDL